jgi:hypothetical protein
MTKEEIIAEIEAKYADVDPETWYDVCVLLLARA